MVMAAFITFLIFYSIGITGWATWRIKTLKDELQKADLAIRLSMAHRREQ